MAGLVDTQIRDSYKSVLRVNDNTDGIDSASKYVGDGEGTDSVLSLSTTKVGIGTTSPISIFEIEDGLTTGGAILTLGTKEPTVVANDVLGRINFYAPLDTGTDSDEIGASIVAVAQDTFSDSVNSTQLEFQTGKSEVATTKMVINEDGNVGIGTAAPSDYASNANDLVVYGSGDSGITIVSGTGNDGSIYFADANSGAGEYRGYIWYNHDVDRMYLGSNAELRVTINEDGEVGIGTATPDKKLEVIDSSAAQLRLTHTNDVDYADFQVDSDGNLDVSVSGTDVKVHSKYVNTQYAYFMVSSGQLLGAIAGTHYAVPFGGMIFGTALVAFGTGPEPLTVYDVSANNNADDLTPVLWYIPDDITVDNVYWFAGGSASTGDDINIHLLSFTIDKGEGAGKGDLSSGAVVAGGAAITSLGYGNIVYQEISPDSANVDAGDVCMATFESDGTNSDYAVNIVVKYHLR